MSHLIDTNVISGLRRRTPDPHVIAWYETVRPSEIFLSVLTLGEIRLGIERLRRKDAAQADALHPESPRAGRRFGMCPTLNP